MYYEYGMKRRGYAPDCQPMGGLAGHRTGDEVYYDYLYYERELSEAECSKYDLDFIGTAEKMSSP